MNTDIYTLNVIRFCYDFKGVNKPIWNLKFEAAFDLASKLKSNYTFSQCEPLKNCTILETKQHKFRCDNSFDANVITNFDDLNTI